MTDTATLHLAGTYRRRVAASLARIWENVFDWEHLAHLHDGSFADCVLLDRGSWGWRVALTPMGGTAREIEMRADRAMGRYTSTTLDGVGTGSKIRVTLTPHGAGSVDVLVAFHLPEANPGRLAALGEAYAAAYARLWDEDEAMMQARERMLARPNRIDRTAPPLDLGDEHLVRAALPLFFELGGAIFRLVRLNGNLVAHAAICPHWLGPLDTAPVIDGAIRCPWHGYRFDVVSGRCAAHPEVRLAAAPSIRIDDGRVIARLC
ncbi:Rieske (2Fe-2S) protein [Sphingomonas oligophenolica]|nr:Rieske (2Fe-2S) protein [Sphingomonas oligophenolica]